MKDEEVANKLKEHSAKHTQHFPFGKLNLEPFNKMHYAGTAPLLNCYNKC